MWIKPLIAILFLLLLISLGRGFYFLMRDKGTTNRTLDSLAVRIVLATVLMGVVSYGMLTGQLRSNAPWHHSEQTAPATDSTSKDINEQE